MIKLLKRLFCIRRHDCISIIVPSPAAIEDEDDEEESRKQPLLRLKVKGDCGAFVAGPAVADCEAIRSTQQRRRSKRVVDLAAWMKARAEKRKRTNTVRPCAV